MPPKRAAAAVAAKATAAVTGKRKNTDHAVQAPVKSVKRAATTTAKSNTERPKKAATGTSKKPKAKANLEPPTTSKPAAKAPAKGVVKGKSKAPAKPATKPAAKAAVTKRKHDQVATETEAEHTGDTTEDEEVETGAQPAGQAGGQSNGPRAAKVKGAATAAAAAESTSEEDDDSDDDDSDAESEVSYHTAKKRKLEAERARYVAPQSFPKKRRYPVINTPSSESLLVFVSGEGEMGELGLGTGANVQGVRRPRLNHNLSPRTVGVVMLACGGMHALALTRDNKILSWGVNDLGALGRLTQYTDEDEDADEAQGIDHNNLNPREAYPTPIPAEYFPPGTVFAGVAAGDSCSFAWTNDGYVYGWGCFRDQNADPLFSDGTPIQYRPELIPELTKVKKVVCGNDHVVALDKNGIAYAWGNGDKSQLGRRLVERTRLHMLTPMPLGVPRKKIIDVASGAYHGLAVDKSGNTWAWGGNNMCQCGDPQGQGSTDQTLDRPRKIANLKGLNLRSVDAGNAHSVGIDDKGTCWVWGRADTGAMGMDYKSLPEDKLIFDKDGRARIVIKPAAVPNVGKVTAIAANGDTTLCANDKGHAYGWGFSMNYQTGTGSQDDVEIATRVKSKGIDENRKVNWLGVGGNFAMFTSKAEDADMVDADDNGGEGSSGHGGKTADAGKKPSAKADAATSGGAAGATGNALSKTRAGTGDATKVAGDAAKAGHAATENAATGAGDAGKAVDAGEGASK